MEGSLQSAVAARQAPFTNLGRADQPRTAQSVLVGGPAHWQVVARAHLNLLAQAPCVPHRIACTLVPQLRDFAGNEAGNDTTARQHASLVGATSRRSNGVSAACTDLIQTGPATAVSGHAMQGQS